MLTTINLNNYSIKNIFVKLPNLLFSDILGKIIIISPNGKDIYFGDFDNNSITVFDAINHKIIQRISTNEPASIAFAPNGFA